MIKIKGKGINTKFLFKCRNCTSTFDFSPVDNSSLLNFCPTCGIRNTEGTEDVFRLEVKE